MGVAVAGRFRHRLFVALLPEAPAAGPAEDRPSFVKDILTDANDAAIAKTIIGLATAWTWT
jgi:hypothetical protein